MKNLLRKLKTIEDHSNKKIAEIMTEKFPSARFTKESVATKWKIIKEEKDNEK